MKKQLKPISDYILIKPDKPTAGRFEVSDMYINEVGVIEDVGPDCSEQYQALKGKRVMFNAWACDEKTYEGHKYYFATESANVVCATL